MAVRLMPANLEPGMLVPADRNVYGFKLWQIACASGAKLAWRVKSSLELPIERVLSDGDNGAIDVGHLFTSGEKLGVGRFGLDHDGTLADAVSLREAAANAAGNETGRVARCLSDLLLDAGADEDIVPPDEIENLLLKTAVARAQGNLAAAARLLGFTRPQIDFRLRSRGIAHDSE